MKTPRYSIIIITFLLLACFYNSASATEYPGGLLQWPAYGLYTNDVNVPDVGIVTSISVYIADAETYMGFDNNAMMLTSPSGTTRYLFDTSTNIISGKNLYLTHFIDSASVFITDGIPPYPGPYQPAENFSAFNGQTMTGIWTLAVYNNALSTSNVGEITNWSLFINEPLPPTPPPTPSPPPVPFPTPMVPWIILQGDAFSAPGQNVTTSIVNAVDIGFIGKVEAFVNFHMLEEGDLDFVGMWLVSPGGTVVTLFEKHMLSEHALYGTWFDDTSVNTNIKNSPGPYVGKFTTSGYTAIPPAGLPDFNNEQILGDWTIVVYNDYSCTAIGCHDEGIMDDWRVFILPLIPTPTPVPTATPMGVTPTPAPTNTPIMTFCQKYAGSFFSWTGAEVETSEINVSDTGPINEVMLYINEAYSDDFSDCSMNLISPVGTNAAIFNLSSIFGHNMFLTKIKQEMAYPLITSGSAPFIGTYRPVESLDAFMGEWMTGTWTLILASDNSSNNGHITDWALEICYASQGLPTPTPPLTPITSPTPPTSSTTIFIFQSGDYDGNGTSDIGVFRPATGLWSVRSVGTSFFGQVGDIPASGDYDGDGTTDLTIFRGSSSLWAAYGVTRVYFGGGSDITVPGDYDGDGSCDIGIYRESSGLWAIRGVTRLYFGSSGDYPIPGDYDGDGFCDFAVFRPASGLWAVNGVTRVYFGVNKDIPVPRDYDGDGSADIGIVRFPGGLWAIQGISRFYFGTSGDYPVPADYVGDGIDYPGIFRSSSGLWAVKGATRVYYGTSGDIPVAR